MKMADLLGLNPNWVKKETSFSNPYAPVKKTRKTLTSAQRIYIWERPSTYGRKCNICGEKITKLSDLELDHIKADSKGGKRLALAHKECNRLKGSGSLSKIQKVLGIKSKKKRVKTTKKTLRRQNNNLLGITPMRLRPIKFG